MSHNLGHGHVTPREDGVKARCGGPETCTVCAVELAEKQRREFRPGTVIHARAQLWLAMRKAMPSRTSEMVDLVDAIEQLVTAKVAEAKGDAR